MYILLSWTRTNDRHWNTVVILELSLFPDTSRGLKTTGYPVSFRRFYHRDTPDCLNLCRLLFYVTDLLDFSTSRHCYKLRTYVSTGLYYELVVYSIQYSIDPGRSFLGPQVPEYPTECPTELTSNKKQKENQIRH